MRAKHLYTLYRKTVLYTNLLNLKSNEWLTKVLGTSNIDRVGGIGTRGEVRFSRYSFDKGNHYILEIRVKKCEILQKKCQNFTKFYDIF
jgi:hypothetical protein